MFTRFVSVLFPSVLFRKVGEESEEKKKKNPKSSNRQLGGQKVKRDYLKFTWHRAVFSPIGGSVGALRLLPQAKINK